MLWLPNKTTKQQPPTTPDKAREATITCSLFDTEPRRCCRSWATVPVGPLTGKASYTAVRTGFSCDSPERALVDSSPDPLPAPRQTWASPMK